ncbi:hypothetical protein SB751_20130 [Cupriavidus sp. SIMBA_020]|uniref:hypothetical protein n=1 Tax=Cupriavidus sp. SIMBA_020 TaxID=3085766 RepID=UPI00397E8D49
MPTVAHTHPKFSPVLTKGKTIAEVVEQYAASLRGTELEPEWLDSANFPEDDNEAMYGPKPDRPWPELGARDRLAVYLQRGSSEGWIVYVDHIGYAGDAPNRTTALQKLLTGKTLSQQHGWDLVRAITKMLDVT